MHLISFTVGWFEQLVKNLHFEGTYYGNRNLVSFLHITFSLKYIEGGHLLEYNIQFVLTKHRLVQCDVTHKVDNILSWLSGRTAVSLHGHVLQKTSGTCVAKKHQNNSIIIPLVLCKLLYSLVNKWPSLLHS